LAQAPAYEAGREDARIVYDQQVARLQEFRQPLEYRIGQPARSAINDQQPRLIALRRGLLGYQVLGKLIVEIRNAHGIQH
jgi:hypothetical protein